MRLGSSVPIVGLSLLLGQQRVGTGLQRLVCLGV